MPHARYLYSKATQGDVVIHDTQHLQEDCNTDQIRASMRRYDDDLEALLSLGDRFHACAHCIQNAARDG